MLFCKGILRSRQRPAGIANLASVRLTFFTTRLVDLLPKTADWFPFGFASGYVANYQLIANILLCICDPSADNRMAVRLHFRASSWWSICLLISLDPTAELLKTF